MQVAKINIAGKSFLLPETHFDNYEFPTYILENLSLLEEFITKGVAAMKKFSTDPFGDHLSDLPDVSEFKQVTGIMGNPFDMRDIEMYLLSNPVDVVVEIDF